IPLPAQTLPAWFEIERYTDTTRTPNVTYYAALTSSDGSTWTQVTGSTIALDLGGSPVVGVAGSSSDPYRQNPATWDNLSIAATAARPAGVCPAGYTCADVGVGSLPGNQDYSNGTWTVTANGSDIWDVYDQFHFISQPMTADGTISARVVSIGPLNPVYDDQWEKAGVMVRATADPQSAYYGVFETPSHGIAVQWRSAPAGASTQILVASP